jgi:ParB family chromosome partitioning protein
MWRELDGWWKHYDVATLAAEATAEEWDSLERMLAKAMSVIEAIRAQRCGEQPEAKREIA